MGVSFTFDEEKATAAIVFLASRGFSDLTKGKICKLIFLADKHHLVRFGRPVTGDRLCAMRDGPVPSSILNMLNDILDRPGYSSHVFLERNVSVNRSFINPHFEASQFCLKDCLSESDMESLASTVRSYGGMTFSELRRITHAMPAYIKAWDGGRPHDSPKMKFEDLFEDDDEAVQGAFEEMIENAELGSAFASLSL
jgi:uncharacterized phage-associated protein